MDNMGNLVIRLINAEGAPATEPNCTIEFVRLDQTVIGRANNVVFPPAHRFTLPAFPQAQNLHCRLTPSLYRMQQSRFFTLEDGKEIDERALVLRDPAQWRPNFSTWNSLSAQFDPLKAILSDRLLKLKHGPDVGMISPAVYDGMDSTALTLAKMALLNLFVVLSTQNDPLSGKPWFSFVKQILVIDQERFVAVVDDSLFDTMQQIANNLSEFREKGFFLGDSSLHTDNIPSAFQLTAPMISVKCAYEQGNTQFTMSRVTSAEGDAVLLDCDMDEHSNIIEHVSDVFTHVFTGGTNPIDIHEYIVHHQPRVDLGYELRPLGQAVGPVAVPQAKKPSPRARAAKRA